MRRAKCDGCDKEIAGRAYSDGASLLCESCAKEVDGAKPLTLRNERYKIVRFYQDKSVRPRTIHSGLTLEQARAHCQDPSTHHVRKDGTVEWFDGYTRE